MATTINSNKNNITISYLPNKNEIDKIPKTPVIMDNIKYPTFTGTNNEETTRQYDKDKLCTSSVWTFYSNAPIEKKSSLLFHALSSELGTVLSNILTFIETTKTILENIKDNNNDGNEVNAIFFQNKSIDNIVSIINTWAPIKVIHFIEYMQQENGIDTNKYMWEEVVNSTYFLYKYFGILVSNLCQIASKTNDNNIANVMKDDPSIRKKVLGVCETLLKHCSQYLNTNDYVILLCNNKMDLLRGNSNNNNNNNNIIQDFSSSTDNDNNNINSDYSNNNNNNIRMMKLPNPLTDNKMKKETIDIFQMYWSEAMGNEMRIRVKELSSPRLIQGKLVVDEDTTTENEKQVKDDMFEMLTMTKTGLAMLKVITLFFHIQITDDNNILYYNMLEKTFYTHLNHMKQLYLISKELLESNTRRNLYMTCVIYSEMLFFSQLWFSVIKKDIDDKNIIVVDINPYDMMCIVGYLQEEIGKYTEETVHKECEHHFRATSYHKKTKQRQQEQEQQQNKIATNNNVEKENNNSTFHSNNNNNNNNAWNKNLVNGLLNDIFKGFLVGIENHNQCFNKATYVTVGSHFPLYISKSFTFVIGKILMTLDLYLSNDKTPKYKGKKSEFKIDLYGIKILLNEILSFKKNVDMYIKKLCNRSLPIDWKRWYYIFHLYLEPKVSKSNSVIAASPEANEASSAMKDYEKWSSHRRMNNGNEKDGDGKDRNDLIKGMKEDMKVLL